VSDKFNLGVGLHWMNMDTYIEGEILVNDGDTEFYRGEASATFPSPDIGFWYMYSWSPKWLFQANADWLAATIGDYSGSLWDASVSSSNTAFDAQVELSVIRA
jgi:hypothetical protein